MRRSTDSRRSWRKLHLAVDAGTGEIVACIGPKLRGRALPAQQGEAAMAVEVLNRMIRVAEPNSVRVS
jgi:hypothetical protein